MTEEECMVLESFAKDLGLSFERFPVAAGHGVFLGMGWRFDEYGEAHAFLFPRRPGRGSRESNGKACLSSYAMRIGFGSLQAVARTHQQPHLGNRMLTHDEIHYLDGITAALRIPFEWREDAQGILAYIGGNGGACNACRTLREAVSSLASETPGRAAISCLAEAPACEFELLTGSD